MSKKPCKPKKLPFPENLYMETYFIDMELEENVFILSAPLPSADEFVSALKNTTLTERERTFLLDRYQNGLAFSAIGKREGISQNAIRVITRRAERKLRETKNFQLLGMHQRPRFPSDGTPNAKITVMCTQEQKNYIQGAGCIAYNSLCDANSCSSCEYNVASIDFVLGGTHISTAGQVDNMSYIAR